MDAGRTGLARRSRLVAALLAVGALGACGPGDDPAAGAERSITVAAAASLAAPFTELADRFTEEHPEVEVRLTFDASSGLVDQILEGAPADVFASADEATMAEVVDAGRAAAPVVFAANGLAIITKPGNPAGIERLADLAGAGVVSLCAEEVPCGRYAAQALAAAGVALDESSVTRGQDAGATLTAVTEGDAVAGIVYVTDAQAAGAAVAAIPVPPEHDVEAAYPIAVVGGADAPAAARAFVDLVLGPTGRAVLADHGFRVP